MIAQTIQLALAPVFVLVAIGNIMNLLGSRLGRVVDRSRHLQERHGATSGREHDMVVMEIRHVDRRIKLIGRAFLLLVLSGLVVAFTVGDGYVVTYGTQVDFRAQPRATFRLLFNALYHGPSTTVTAGEMGQLDTDTNEE